MTIFETGIVQDNYLLALTLCSGEPLVCRPREQLQWTLELLEFGWSELAAQPPTEA